MAGILKTNSIQLGDSATDSQNFQLRTNVNGTATLARGAAGNLGDILTVDAAGFVGLAGGQKLKTVKITGTTAAAAATATSNAHGIADITKIISISGAVRAGSGLIIPLFHSVDAAYAVSAYINATNLQIVNGGSAGSDILNRPVTVLITYEA